MVLDDIHEAGKRGFRAILLCDLIEPPIQPVSVPSTETSDGLSGGLGRPIRRSLRTPAFYSLRQDFCGLFISSNRHPKEKPARSGLKPCRRVTESRYYAMTHIYRIPQWLSMRTVSRVRNIAGTYLQHHPGHFGI